MPPKEPRPASHFRLSIGGKEGIGNFRECQGLDSENSVIEHTSVDEQGRPVIRKVAGPLKWSNITLKRGVDESADLWQWRDQVIKEGPDKARTDGFIELLDYTGSPIARWKFVQGWPIKYTGASLDPKSSEVAVEEVQIAHEGLERE
ncbi:MAG: phage tail protein [Actinomycetota bacterium]